MIISIPLLSSEHWFLSSLSLGHLAKFLKRKLGNISSSYLYVFSMNSGTVNRYPSGTPLNVPDFDTALFAELPSRTMNGLRSPLVVRLRSDLATVSRVMAEGTRLLGHREEWLMSHISSTHWCVRIWGLVLWALSFPGCCAEGQVLPGLHDKVCALRWGTQIFSNEQWAWWPLAYKGDVISVRLILSINILEKTARNKGEQVLCSYNVPKHKRLKNYIPTVA